MPLKDPVKRAEYSKAYRKRNPARIARYNKAYREQNREKIAAQTKTYREQNREMILAQHKAYRESNTEKLAQQKAAWYYRNREKQAARSKVYRKNNPELVAEYSRKKRYSKRNATVPLSEKEQEKLRLLESTRLELQRETEKQYHIDHILPIRYGGIHHPINLRILEGEENMSKKAKILPEAIDLATEHFRLYNDRVSPERAWEFVQQLAEGLGFSEQEVQDMMAGKPIRSKPTLEGFME